MVGSWVITWVLRYLVKVSNWLVPAGGHASGTLVFCPQMTNDSGVVLGFLRSRLLKHSVHL